VRSQRRIVTIALRCIDRQNVVTGPAWSKNRETKEEWAREKKRNRSKMDLLWATLL